jgi:hypothetical protein
VSGRRTSAEEQAAWDAEIAGFDFEASQADLKVRRDAWANGRAYPDYTVGYWVYARDIRFAVHDPTLVEMHDDDDRITHTMGGTCICGLQSEGSVEFWFRLDNGEIWELIYERAALTRDIGPECLTCHASIVNGKLVGFQGDPIEYDIDNSSYPSIMGAESILAHIREEQPDWDPDDIAHVQIEARALVEMGDV